MMSHGLCIQNQHMFEELIRVQPYPEVTWLLVCSALMIVLRALYRCTYTPGMVAESIEHWSSKTNDL